MKVGVVLVIIFFLFALIGSIGGTSYYYTQSVRVIEEQVYSHLETAAHSRAKHIETQLKMEKELTESLALIEKVEKLLLESESDADYNNKKTAVEERLQKTADSNKQIMSISVVDKSGIIIAGTNSQMIGRDKTTDSRFSKVNNGETAISNVHFSREGTPAFGTASPVKSGDETIGFVFMRLDMEKALFPLLLDKIGIGGTGETYLVNNDGYAISPLLFEEDAVLKWKMSSINSRNCLEHEGEEHIYEPITVYLDYRGEKVLGAHAYIPETGWCLLAEVNEEEILGIQRRLFQKVSLALTIAMTILFSLAGFFVGEYIDKMVVLKKSRKKL